MLRLFRFGLPALWLVSLIAGMGGVVSTTLLLGAIAVWVMPWLQGARPASVGPAKPGASPMESSFDLEPSAGGWTRFTVFPARGQGPKTSVVFTTMSVIGGLFGAGAVGAVVGNALALPVFVIVAPVLAYGLNWALHRYFYGALFVAQYRKVVQAPNIFDIGPEGIRVGTEHIPLAALLKFVERNPFTRAVNSVGITTVVVNPGTVHGTAQAVGAGLLQASAMQSAAVWAQMALHGWILEAVDQRGNVVRLAGGMTENTLAALLHAIQQRLPG